MPLVLRNSGDDEHGVGAWFGAVWLFDGGALVGDIKIMIEPAAEFFGEAPEVGLADFDSGLIHEGPQGDGEIMFHGSDG